MKRTRDCYNRPSVLVIMAPYHLMSGHLQLPLQNMGEIVNQILLSLWYSICYIRLNCGTIS